VPDREVEEPFTVVLMSARAHDGTLLTAEAVEGLAGRDCPLVVEGGVDLPNLRIRVLRAWIEGGDVMADLQRYVSDEAVGDGCA